MSELKAYTEEELAEHQHAVAMYKLFKGLKSEII